MVQADAAEMIRDVLQVALQRFGKGVPLEHPMR